MKSIYRLNVLLAFHLMLISSIHGQPNKVKNHFKQLQKDNQFQPMTLSFVSEEDGLVEDYSKLSQIILIRHGKPKLDHKGWRNRNEAVQYVKAYDSVGIYPPAFIPAVIGEDELNAIYTSSINRSISTAQLVFNRDNLLHSDSLFREFERKVFAFPNIKLPTKWWLAGSRVLWFMGLNKKGIERFSEARERARRGADFLEQDALEHGKTLLVSHGLLNHYLTKYLKRLGWKQVYDGGSGYLSQKMFVKYLP